MVYIFWMLFTFNYYCLLVKGQLSLQQTYAGFSYIKEISFDKFKITRNILVLKAYVTCFSGSLIQCAIQSTDKEEYVGFTVGFNHISKKDSIAQAT